MRDSWQLAIDIQHEGSQSKQPVIVSTSSEGFSSHSMALERIAHNVALRLKDSDAKFQETPQNVEMSMSIPTTKWPATTDFPTSRRSNISTQFTLQRRLASLHFFGPANRFHLSTSYEFHQCRIQFPYTSSTHHKLFGKSSNRRLYSKGHGCIWSTHVDIQTNFKAFKPMPSFIPRECPSHRVFVVVGLIMWLGMSHFSLCTTPAFQQLYGELESTLRLCEESER